MGPKRLYFLLATATTVGAVAGAYGNSVVMTDEPIAGYTQYVEYETVLRPTPPQMIATINANLATGACPAIRADGGKCQPSKLDFDIINERRRGIVRTVGRYPQHRHVDRELPPSPTKRGWLNGVIQSRFCPTIDARYGDGVCDPTTIEYTLRNIRTNGVTRTYASFRVPVFCAQPPPADPNPPDVDL